jgi:hypothetical protein
LDFVTVFQKKVLTYYCFLVIGGLFVLYPTNEALSVFRAPIYQQVSISSFAVLLLLGGSLYPPVLSYVLLFFLPDCANSHSSKHVVCMHDSKYLLDATSKDVVK